MQLTEQGKEAFKAAFEFFEEHPDRWIVCHLALPRVLPGKDEVEWCHCFAGKVLDHLGHDPEYMSSNFMSTSDLAEIMEKETGLTPEESRILMRTNDRAYKAEDAMVGIRQLVERNGVQL
jgi:hypothetical protein